MISKRIIQSVVRQSAIRARLYCLVAVTLSSGCYSLLGQGTGQGTALGGHSAEEGFSGGGIHRGLCFATADCGNPGQPGSFGTAPIGIGSFTLSPQQCSNPGLR